MKPSMSAPLGRKVWKRTTSFMDARAALSTASTLASACRVCAPTSPGPTTCASAPPPRPPTWRTRIPPCPATTTISPGPAIMPCEYMPRGGPSVFPVTARGAMTTSSGKPDVLELDGLAVDPTRGRGDPAGELARLRHALHEAPHERLIRGGGQPPLVLRVPLGLADDPPVGRDLDVGEGADGAMEGAMGQLELRVDAVLLDHLVPPSHPAGAVGHVVVAQPLIQGDQRRLRAGHEPVTQHVSDGVGLVLQPVIVVLLGLLDASLQPHRVEVGGVGGDLGAEEVQGHRAVEVDVLLDRREVDAPVLPHIVRPVLAHQLARALHDPLHARLAHEHVVGLLGQHEPAGLA